MKHIDGINGCLARLLKAKHEVNPAGQVRCDIVGLQDLTMNQREESRVVVSPGW